MENVELEELKTEADSLGITYSANIGAKKLQEKIDEFYANESKTNSSTVEVKEEVGEEIPKGETARQRALRIIKQQEIENRKTVVVKLSCVDKREASTATHAYFSSGATSLNVPLDVYVEMPKILVDLAERAQALVHVDKDGLTMSKMQKRYVVEYKK